MASELGRSMISMKKETRAPTKGKVSRPTPVRRPGLGWDGPLGPEDREDRSGYDPFWYPLIAMMLR